MTTRVIDTAQCLKYSLNQLKWLKTGVIAGSGFTSAGQLGLDRSVDAVIARRYSLSSTDYAMDRGPDLKTTGYFEHMRKRPDRAMILDEWITHVIQFPEKTEVQSDGRIRRWAWVPEESKFLRVILLEDEETVHNAFFDRSFKESRQ